MCLTTDEALVNAPGGSSGRVRGFTVRGNKAYFVAAVEDGDFQLFETDGTVAGTQSIAPPNPKVTKNPMGQKWLGVATAMPPPTLLGDTLLFKAGFHGAPLLYRY